MIEKIITNININCQSSIKINDALTIYFDPYDLKEETHDADYIFITHPHWDHFNIESIKKIIKEETIIIGPHSVIKDLPKENLKTFEVVDENDYHVGNIYFKTIPAYNIFKEYHPKERGDVGYLLTLNNITYYIPGDTDVIEPLHNLKADCIFLPVGGTYTMDKDEAVRLANELKPKIAIPIHYGLAVGTKADALYFKNNLEKSIVSKIYY